MSSGIGEWCMHATIYPSQVWMVLVIQLHATSHQSHVWMELLSKPCTHEPSLTSSGLVWRKHATYMVEWCWWVNCASHKPSLTCLKGVGEWFTCHKTSLTRLSGVGELIVLATSEPSCLVVLVSDVHTSQIIDHMLEWCEWRVNYMLQLIVHAFKWSWWLICIPQAIPHVYWCW